jgi:hypothetical protein
LWWYALKLVKDFCACLFLLAIHRQTKLYGASWHALMMLLCITCAAPKMWCPLTSQQVPAGYDATYKHFAAQGARVIALARRSLSGDLSGPELRGLSREDVEAEMEFEGFAVFQVGARVPRKSNTHVYMTSGKVATAFYRML